MDQFFTLCVLCFSFIFCPVFTQETFNTMPPPVVTNFTCRGREMGFYADLEMNCRVYHNCDDHGNKFTYYCPIDTAFRQEAMVCDHAHLVKCQSVDENPPDKSGFSSSSDRKNSGFSRSFRIGQDSAPSNTVQNKNPTFVLSSSVFLRNQTDTFKKPTTFHDKNFSFSTTKPVDFSRSNFPVSSTVRSFPSKALSNKDSFNHFSNQDSDFLEPPPVRDDFFKQPSFSKTTPKNERTSPEVSTFGNQGNKNKNVFINRDQVFPKSKSRPLMFLEPPFFEGGKTTSSLEFTTKSPFNFAGSNYPYTETLRSIQRESRPQFSSTTRRSITTKSTTKQVTELPFAALTASLKPLIPNEVENDPYYPKFPTSTEIHYTPRDTSKHIKPSKFSTRTHSTDLHLRIPSVLPDLNSIDDLVDRRKIFYIPKTRF